ncbi:hypothetical protein SS50377_20948 [Spironucleus salmonicida]|uniref:Uncharacterized protein n=1 Tax=Spironucleus salmonicida TaxID=348837 RepID=A0A9P8S1T4_9EUKA|nr:hypothetical protein SS50377_20948 [Spironucleus salmonicida]
MDENIHSQPLTIWSERRSSIRSGHKEKDGLQKLNSQSFIRKTTEFFETRETANALPSLEDLSDDTKNQKLSPVELLYGKLELSRDQLIILIKQVNKQLEVQQRNYQQVESMVVINNKQVKILRKRVI